MRYKIYFKVPALRLTHCQAYAVHSHRTFFHYQAIEGGWDLYFYYQVPFGILGAVLMYSIAGRKSLKKGAA